MNSWILIIAMYSPGGDFLNIKVQLSQLDSPMQVKHKGLCVTKAHWEGKKQMPGVAYD